MSATPVNKEAIRVLVLQHGQREAARIAGLNEDTVCSWAKRYQWKAASKPQAKTGNTKLIEKISDELSDNERETRLSLSRYAKDAAGELSSGKHKLMATKEAKEVAQTASIVHKWGDNDKTGQSFTLNVLNMGAFGVTVGDSEAEA